MKLEETVILKLWSSKVVVERAILHPKSATQAYSIMDINRNFIRVDYCNAQSYSTNKYF